MNYHNIYTPLQHIRRPAIAPGGLCWAVFTAWENVQQWPEVDPVSGLCATPIQLADGKTWYELQLSDFGRVFEENMQVSGSGPYWSMQLKGHMGGNNSAQTLAFASMANHQYVVMFRDRDAGQIRFMGNQDTGADFICDYGSGDGGNNRRRNVIFGWEHSNPAPIYIGSLDGILDDIITPPFAGQGDFNDDFNDDFFN